MNENQYCPPKPGDPIIWAGNESGAYLNQRLRTLLNTIIGFAELLAAQSNKGTKNDGAEHILRAGREMLDLINGELDVPGSVSSQAGGAESSSRSVLYIEDDAVNFKLVESILRKRPELELLHATHGETGLTLAQTHTPRLILLDLNLPDIHGAEVLRRLRQDQQTSQIPVVVISADATPSQIERLLTAGARNYLTKPFELQNFLAVIDGILEEESDRRT